MKGAWKMTLLTALCAILCSSSMVFGAVETPKGWIARGSHPQDYEMGTDAAAKHGGKFGAYIKLKGDKSEGFGTLMQMFKADDYKGKRVRMSAYVKAENVEEYAGLWMRLDGNGKGLGFDNMQDRPIKGTSEWKKYEVVLDVPENAVDIAFGVLLGGKGRVSVDDFQFEVVGKDTPTTNIFPPEEMNKERKMQASREFPKQPANLDFES